MQLQASRHSANNDYVNYSQSPSAPVSFGIDAASEAWEINVSTVGFPNQQLISWQLDHGGFGTITDDEAKIITAVSGPRTYVVADLPRDVAAVGHLQINRDGLDPVVVPFNDAQPESDRTVAAYAFSEPVNYIAQIIGADGAVLASWPSG